MVAALPWANKNKQEHADINREKLRRDKRKKQRKADSNCGRFSRDKQKHVGTSRH